MLNISIMCFGEPRLYCGGCAVCSTKALTVHSSCRHACICQAHIITLLAVCAPLPPACLCVTVSQTGRAFAKQPYCLLCSDTVAVCAYGACIVSIVSAPVRNCGLKCSPYRRASQETLCGEARRWRRPQHPHLLPALNGWGGQETV